MYVTKVPRTIGVHTAIVNESTRACVLRAPTASTDRIQVLLAEERCRK